jgi:hypothetical protein
MKKFRDFYREQKKKKKKKPFHISMENLLVNSQDCTGARNYINTPPYGNPPNALSNTTSNTGIGN